MRYKIILEYIGAGYCGWQTQDHGLSLQQIVENAIYCFTKEKVIVTAAGRTDAGVNAYGQVAHFDLSQEFPEYRLMQAINHFCRDHTIGVIDIHKVSQDFNARFDARCRHYVYKILNRNSVNIINKNLMYLVKHSLDIGTMQQAANYLVGKHDFSSFRARHCQASSPIRTMDKIEIIRDNEYVSIYFSALSFLHHMVRNIVGSLIMVGKGYWSPEKILHILQRRERLFAGPTAPAQGLYFLKVDY
jgi:tRNA pseudouridine38-40 synthase